MVVRRIRKRIAKKERIMIVRFKKRLLKMVRKELLKEVS